MPHQWRVETQTQPTLKGLTMRTGISWPVYVVAIAAVVLSPSFSPAQCPMSARGRGSGIGMSGGGRGAGLQGTGFTRNGIQMGPAIKFIVMVQQSQLQQQMNLIRRQQEASNRLASAPDPARFQTPQTLSRPGAVQQASPAASHTKPTMSRQERLRAAIQEQRRITSERRAARQTTRRRSANLVFNGAGR